MLEIAELTYRIAGRTLIDGAAVSIPDGHRVGLVGRNGAGKSTLLDLIRGVLGPDAGRIVVRPGARVGFLAQEAPGGEGTPLATVLAADRERASLLAEAETVTDPHRVAEVHERLVAISAHDAEARAARILAGLGFDADAMNRPLGAFSGGWRMRVALAAILFAQPDLLLLDEPTNHLDLEATIWLEGHLARYPGTMILVSHDRHLLNGAADHILHIDRGRLTLYRGGYDSFIRQREERRSQLQAVAVKTEARRKHMQAFVDRFRYKASKARQAQSRLKALERLPVIAIDEDEAGLAFSFPEPPRMSPPLLTARDVAIGYDGVPVLRHVDFRIDPEDRIALLGRNGNGKSTLARLLAGSLEPLEGELGRASKLTVGYFAQHQLESLEVERTAFEHMAEAMPKAPPVAVRAFHGRFGLSQQKADVAVASLSGGERARLAIALACRAAPSLLVLDEPTNHLDVDARTALVEALADFPGAVVLIAHDWSLVEATADSLWLVADGTVRPFDGDLDAYKTLVLEPDRSEPRARGGENERDRRAQRRQAAESRAQLAPLRKRVSEAAARVERLTRERGRIEARLADPRTYGDPAVDVPALIKAKGAIDRDIEAAEAAWLEAETALDAAKQEQAA